LRPPRRRRPDPGQHRQNDPPPARPRRRPQAQPGAAHDPAQPPPNRPGHDRLPQTASERGQNPTRSAPLPEALPRPQPLPPTREVRNDRLTNIEASPRHGPKGEGAGAQSSPTGRRALSARFARSGLEAVTRPWSTRTHRQTTSFGLSGAQSL